MTRYLNDPNIDPDPDPSPTINPRDITDTQDHTFGDACLYTVTFRSADDDNGFSPVDTIQVIIVGNADEPMKSEHWKHEFTQSRPRRLHGRGAELLPRDHGVHEPRLQRDA